LLTDRGGCPVAVEGYPGNTGDPTTVPDQIGKLRNRFGFQRVVLVVDRGILTQTQIEMLKAEMLCPDLLRSYNKIGQISRTTRKTEDGLGDILVKGRYYVLEETDTLPLVGITGNIKLPTADEHKGLGTGELDAGFGFEFSKNFSDSWQAYFDIGYTFLGDPPGTDLRNQWFFDIGAGYYLAPELLVSAYYEESRALVAGEDNPRDLFLALNYDFSSEIEFTAGLLLGLSDGASDYGFTGGIRFRF